MADHVNLPPMSYYKYKLDVASDLYHDAIAEEDSQKVILDASKLKECRAICNFLVERRKDVPFDIQALASYFLAAGRSDDVARGYLAKAVLCCERFEEETGTFVTGRDVFNEAYHQMLVAMGAEQSEFGGVAIGPFRNTEKSKNGGGLPQARGLPTMEITAPSTASGSKKRLSKIGRSN